MDIYRFHAKKQNAVNDTNKAKWTGGDEEDRREYIKKKKQEMGANLERMLTLSSKRSP